MRADIRSSINAIQHDRSHGASWLTSAAIKVLLDACDAGSTAGPHFNSEVLKIADALMKARPGMASIANYVLRFSEEFKQAITTSRSVVNQQKRGFAIASRLIQLHEKSIQQLPVRAAHLVKNRSIVMTCSYSDSICATLEHARRRGIDFKVLAVQSLFNKISYGQMVIDRLSKIGISCKLVMDDQLRWHTARANLILIGADAISLQGWLLNGSPSYELARVAAVRKVPVYALCCKSKIDSRGVLAAIRQAEPGFDMVPLDLLAGIVTESGIITAQDVLNFNFDDIFRSKHARSD